MAKVVKKSGRAQAIIDFIEKLIVPSGHGQGTPFVLEPFQKKFIRAVYEPHFKTARGWRRAVRRAVLSVGRKNGKSALISALVIVHLVGPEQIPNGEIYSAATEREQAAIIFRVAAQIVRADQELMDVIKIIDSTKTMVCYQNGSVYRAVSAEAGSKYGYNPSFVIYDELAQAKNRELYDALDTSMGAREEPLFATISTQSNDPQHILSQLIDDGRNETDPTTVVHLYETDQDADIFDEKSWYTSNPALGIFRSLDDFRSMADRAKRMPSFENTFRNLYLNQRTDAKSPLIPRAEWVACNGGAEFDKGEEVYLALDLSATTDLCSMIMLSASGGDRVLSYFWKPKDCLDSHEKRDRVPYILWEKKGFIEAPSGRSIDYGFVAGKIQQIQSNYTILGVAYDRWRIELLMKELSNIGVNVMVEGKDYAKGDSISSDVLKLVPWGQGFKDMAGAVDEMENSILERRLQHDGNPVLTWCFSNAHTISDAAGNRKLDKSKSRFRIDGVVACAMALGLKRRDKVGCPVVSAYENMDIETIRSCMVL